MDRVVALFAGAGGLSLGFAQAGLKPCLAAEIDRDACGTYAQNLGLEPFQRDLADTQAVDEIVANLGAGETLAVIGGPPCQGFSTAGSRNDEDPRNRLILNYLYIVNALRPRWFVFENVEGILTSGGGRSLANFTRMVVESGYSVRLEKVNFAGYGLPQSRKRVIIVGNRIGMNFKFPEFTHSFNSGKHRSKHDLPLAPSLMDAFAGLGEAASRRGEKVAYASAQPLHEYDLHIRRGFEGPVSLHYSTVGAADRQRLSILKPGQTMKDLPDELWHESYRKRAFRRVADGTPTEKRGGAPSGIKRLQGHLNALTITGAATREFIHPVHPRPLTIRECARLQAFPDDYEFVGRDGSRIKQIGNAFPAFAARLFAEHIMYLDGLAGSGMAVPGQQSPGLLGYHLTDATGMSPALQKTAMLLEELRNEQFKIPLVAE